MKVKCLADFDLSAISVSWCWKCTKSSFNLIHFCFLSAVELGLWEWYYILWLVSRANRISHMVQAHYSFQFSSLEYMEIIYYTGNINFTRFGWFNVPFLFPSQPFGLCFLFPYPPCLFLLPFMYPPPYLLYLLPFPLPPCLYLPPFPYPPCGSLLPYIILFVFALSL